MSVKMGCKGYPKHRLFAAVQERHEHKHLKIEADIAGEVRTIFASSHKDI